MDQHWSLITHMIQDGDVITSEHTVSMVLHVYEHLSGNRAATRSFILCDVMMADRLFSCLSVFSISAGLHSPFLSYISGTNQSSVSDLQITACISKFAE